jgi:hypothetical protein
VLTYVLGNKTVIANEDPLHGQHVSLVELTNTFEQTNLSVDGVTHDGYNVLYHVFDGSRTSYYLYPRTQQAIYTVTGQGGAAIWSSVESDSFLFISTLQGIVQLDLTTKTPHLLLPSLPGVQLLFYRDHYLYYIQNTKTPPYSDIGTVFRVDIAQPTLSPVQVTPCSQATSIWLDPLGTTVYYQCLAHGANDLYAVDGKNAHLLRANAGEMVGYASDGSVIVMRASDGRFQVVQLGTSIQQDQVVIADVAPGALTVKQSNVAVAPYGYMLVARGTYGGNVEKLWYGDLMTQGTQLVQLPIGARHVNTIGWDRLAFSS